MIQVLVLRYFGDLKDFENTTSMDEPFVSEISNHCIDNEMFHGDDHTIIVVVVGNV
jgi:hypothetical protein